MQIDKNLIVFPTSRAIREYVKDLGNNTFLPSCLTIDNFFNKVVYFDNYTLVDNNQKLFFLLEAVKNVDLKKLGIIENFNVFLKQSDYLFKFIDEISLEDIDIKKLKDFDTYGFYEEHLSLLENIYNSYENILEENKKIDKLNYKKHFSINDTFLKEYDSITFKYEGYLNVIEYEILMNISSHTRLIIEFYYYSFNHKSIKRFIDLGFELEENYFYTIDLSNNEIIKKEKISSKKDNVIIQSFETRINQIAFIKKSIYDMVNSGVNPQDITLILPDEKFANYLQLFDNEKYFNYAFGYSINDSDFIHIQRAIYNYLIDKKEKQNILYLELFISLDKVCEIIDDSNSKINKENVSKYITFLYDFIKENEIKEKFESLIYKFTSLIFKYNIDIKFIDIIKIILDISSEITMDDNNGGKITVMGLLETRNSLLDNIILIDFNDDFIPKVSKKDKFLSSVLKEKIGLPTSKDREDLQKYYYKRIYDNAKNIYISYTNNDISKKSRFLNILYPHYKDKKNLDSMYEEILYTNKKVNYIDRSINLDFNVNNFDFSATSLKVFFECRRKFYYKYIAKLKDHNSELRPKGYELGSFVHEFLEFFYKQNDISLKNFEYLYSKMIQDKGIINPYLLFEINIWKNKLKDFLSQDLIRFESSNKLINTEKRFDIKLDGINFVGSIDRIDYEDNIYKIIDYKTSSSFKVDTSKNYEDSNDFQMEIYYLYLNNELNNKDIECYYYNLNNSKLIKEEMLEEKIKLLYMKIKYIKSLNNENLDFSKTDEIKNCNFCDYRYLCNR